MIKCGLAEVNITPRLGSIIPGQFHIRYSVGIKEDLYAKAMVIDNGINMLAIVAIDTIEIERLYVDKIRMGIYDKTGINEADIMVSATHIHTGGPVEDWGENTKKDLAYIEWMIGKCIDAALLAFKKLKPVKIGMGNGSEAGISFNRRYLMKNGKIKTNPGIGNQDIVKAAGTIDSDVTVLRIDDTYGNLIGVVTNFACHLDVTGGEEYSSDYPGEMSCVLKKVYGENIVSIFLTGACGNINHIDVSGKFVTEDGHYHRMGKILAGEVIKTLESIDTSENIEVKSTSCKFDLSIRQPSPLDVESAKITVNTITQTHEELARNSYAKLVDLFFAKEAIRMSIEKEEKVNIEVQIFKIGDLGITALPGEIFVEFGLDIKNNSPYQYNMINTLANGIYGYVPTREALQAGGYESMLCWSSKLEPDAGYKMADKTIELLNKLK